MADRKLMEEYENSLMSLAVSEMLEKMGKELEEEYKNMEDIPPDPEAGKRFYRALDREYKKGRRREFGKKAAKFGRYAVTVCAAVIVAVSISVVSVDALRVKFLDWLANIRPTHTTYNDYSRLNSIYVPEYLPKDYVLQSFNNEGVLTTETFSDSEENHIMLTVCPEDFVYNADNENTDNEVIKINDSVGIYFVKDDCITLIWNKEGNNYTISTNDFSISKDEIIKIAQSIK